MEAVGDAACGTPVNFWQVVRDALTTVRVPWNPDDDEDVRFLRRQTALAQAETIRLRRNAAFPLARSTRTRDEEKRDAD